MNGRKIALGIFTSSLASPLGTRLLPEHLQHTRCDVVGRHKLGWMFNGKLAISDVQPDQKHVSWMEQNEHLDRQLPSIRETERISIKAIGPDLPMGAQHVE